MTALEFSTRDGTLLAWDEVGSGDTVLFVHGIGSSRQRWDPQVEALSLAGFHCVRLDLRGFGASGGAEQRVAMDTFVADVVEFSSVIRAERFHLVGHSLGGMIAQKYAVDHRARVASLVLASTTSHNGRRATAFARAMVSFAERGFDGVLADALLRAEVEHALAEAFPRAPLPLEFLRSGMERPNPALANAWRACIDFSVKERLSELTCPVLVTHGTADRLIPFRAGQLIHEAIPHSEWVEQPQAGHSLHGERARPFTAALLAFLRRHSSRL